jgi:hypothetical protein
VSHFSGDLAIATKNDKQGFIDRTGKTVIPLTYDKVYPFVNGLAIVKKGDKMGYINRQNQLVIPAAYDEAYDFSEGTGRGKIKREVWVHRPGRQSGDSD